MLPPSLSKSSGPGMLEPLLLPMVLAFRDPAAESEPLVFTAGPIPCTSGSGPTALASRKSPVAPEGTDPAAWIRGLAFSRLEGVEVTTRFQPLLPRLMPHDSLLLTVWATGRAIGPGGQPLSEGLQSIADRIGDRSFPAQTLAAIRRSLVADPFLARTLGEEARSRASGEEDLLGTEGREVPAVVGLLPEAFSLADLHAAVAGLLGRSPKELESGSNFRRRIQDLLHRGVLVEQEAAAWPADRERVGRPPRRYRFSPEGWRRWLLGRTSLESPIPELKDRANRDRELFARLERSFGNVARGLSEEPIDRVRQSLWRELAPPSQAPSTEDRLSRVERLLEQVLLQSKRAEPGA